MCTKLASIDRYAVTVPAVWVARDNKAAGFDITVAFKIEKSKVIVVMTPLHIKFFHNNRPGSHCRGTPRFIRGFFYLQGNIGVL